MNTVTAAEESAPMVLQRHQGAVAFLTLNRPAQYNALCEEMLSALEAALDGIAADSRVRVVVLAGAGKAFCAGHDLKQMRANPSLEYYRELFAGCSRLMMRIQTMPQP